MAYPAACAAEKDATGQGLRLSAREYQKPSHANLAITYEVVLMHTTSKKQSRLYLSLLSVRDGVC